MGVFLPIPIGKVATAQEPPSQTYRLDLERGRIYGRADGLDAVRQAIHKALITPRFHCLIYSNQYGSEIKRAVVAEDASPEYIETEIPRLIKDALAPDGRIIDAAEFSIALEGEQAFIRFTAKTIFGDTVIEEAV